jgi:outer membrane protein
VKKNTQTILIIINVILILIVSSCLIKNFIRTGSQTVYVDNEKLFDNFNMTKELKRLGEKEFNSKKTITDSLYKKINSSEIPLSEKKVLMQKFMQSKEELEQFNQNFAVEETTKIWSRIHSYTAEFSKENKYQLVIGSQNKQSVLFADENIDVTNKLLIYINKKYEGLK